MTEENGVMHIRRKVFIWCAFLLTIILFAGGLTVASRTSEARKEARRIVAENISCSFSGIGKQRVSVRCNGMPAALSGKENRRAFVDRLESDGKVPPIFCAKTREGSYRNCRIG